MRRLGGGLLEMEVQRVGRCVVIHMRLGENRLNPAFLAAFHEALDKAEA